MSVESRLSYRATIERENRQGHDDYGQPIEKREIVAVAVPCYVYQNTGNSERTRNLDAMELIVKNTYVIFRKSQVVVKDDRVSIQDRRGEVIFDTMRVDSVIDRKRYKMAICRSYG